jgi:hypothetical protein
MAGNVVRMVRCIVPRDQWSRESRRVEANKASKKPGKWTPKYKKLKSPVEIQAGTRVLVGKGDYSTMKPHVMKKTVRFTHFREASAKALMFEHDGWNIWVSKQVIGYR